MLDLIKKELASTVKWTFLIGVATFSYYLVAPKYQAIDKEQYRINTITGQVYESPKVGMIRWAKPYNSDKNKNFFEDMLTIEKEHGFWFIEEVQESSPPKGYYFIGSKDSSLGFDFLPVHLLEE